jgi:hypothetical protein
VNFVQSLTLPDLGTGAAFALWSFRAIALGNDQCCAIKRGYDAAFGDDRAVALKAMCDFTWVLGNAGGRRISLGPSGCCRVTADELCIVATLSAAQSEQTWLCKAHLSWLLCGKAEQPAERAALQVGDIFQCAGLDIVAPAIELSPPKRKGLSPVFHEAGRA